MKYILLFLCILSLSCKYNVANPVGTLKDYTAGSGKIYYVSSSSSVAEIEDALRKNKHSLEKYLIKVSPTNDKSTAILTNIKKVLDKNPHFNNVEIDLSLTEIPEIPKEMFTNTTNLGKITLPDTVTNIEEKAFSGCYSLNSIRFPNNLENISEGAFSNCSGLKLIILSSGALTNISNNAFYGSSSLVSIILSGSLTNICNDAFSNCSKLANVEYLGKTNSLPNCSPFSSSSYPTNLYLPEVEESGKTNFTNFLGKSWSNGNIHTKKHIPYNK